MPTTVLVGLVALAAALVLYSMGVWGAFRAKVVTARHVAYLWAGFALDVVATAAMAVAAGGLDLSPLADLLHTVVSIAAMLAMLGGAISATLAVRDSNERARTAVAKWLWAPWAFWVVVFLWGLVSRGAQRGG